MTITKKLITIALVMSLIFLSTPTTAAEEGMNEENNTQEVVEQKNSGENLTTEEPTETFIEPKKH